MCSENIDLKVGDEIGRYTVLDAKNPDKVIGMPASQIGEGQTSKVFAVKQDLDSEISIKRAMKIFFPSQKVTDRREKAGLTSGKSDFLSEIKSMASFSHQNLVKIIDAGIYKKDHRYFVMEFIDGESLSSLIDHSNSNFNQWYEKAQTDPFIVLRMIRQILWPIDYLHDQRYFHFDIAPKNIFVSLVNDKPHLILGDLGVGKRLPHVDELDSKKRKKKIFIAGTREYTPAIFHEYLNKKPIEQDLLTQYAAYWDVYATACVLEGMMRNWGLWDNPDLEAAKLLCQRLKEQSQGTNAQYAVEEFGRLLPIHVLTAGVPELSQRAFVKGITNIIIPLYPVPASRRIRTIIDHPIFARLHLVPQLLLVRSVHSGGVHSRYEHALGSYALGRRYIVKLLSQPEFRVQFSQKELEETLLVILLATIVTFPLDHVFFEVFPDEAKSNSTMSRVNRLKFFWAWSRNDVPSLAALIKKHFPLVDLEIVTQVIGRSETFMTEQTTLMSGIIKSSIDVRVVDYLLRDSHHTGIPSGMGIDADDIINNLKYIKSKKRLGIKREGVHSVENLLCARYWMYNRVYWNTINRSLASMLRYTIYALIKKGNLSQADFFESILFLDEHAILRKLKEWWEHKASPDYKPFSLIDNLLYPRPRSYPPILELSGKKVSSQVIESARNLTPKEFEDLRIDMIENIKSIKNLKKSSLLLDIPMQRTLKLGEDVDVDIDGEIIPLTAASDIVKSLEDAFKESAFKLRAFCDPLILNNLDTKQKEKLSAEIKEFLLKKLT